MLQNALRLLQRLPAAPEVLIASPSCYFRLASTVSVRGRIWLVPSTGCSSWLATFQSTQVYAPEMVRTRIVYLRVCEQIRCQDAPLLSRDFPFAASVPGLDMITDTQDEFIPPPSRIEPLDSQHNNTSRSGTAMTIPQLDPFLSNTVFCAHCSSYTCALRTYNTGSRESDDSGSTFHKKKKKEVTSCCACQDRPLPTARRSHFASPLQQRHLRQRHFVRRAQCKQQHRRIAVTSREDAKNGEPTKDLNASRPPYCTVHRPFRTVSNWPEDSEMTVVDVRNARGLMLTPLICACMPKSGDPQRPISEDQSVGVWPGFSSIVSSYCRPPFLVSD